MKHSNCLFKGIMLAIAFVLLVPQILNAQFCTTNPAAYDDHVVSGQFSIQSRADDEFNDVVMLRQVGNSLVIDVLAGGITGPQKLKLGVSVFPNYDLSKVNGRVVSGDFDQNGWFNDFAVIYEESAYKMRVDVFKSNLGATPSFTKHTYLTLNGYDPNKVTGRVVSGDFDRDNNWDDIAMFYDYGGGQTRIHVLKGYTNSFGYSGSTGWWSAFGYTSNMITDRVVSGDFDRDGKEDDIAAFYDYGGGQTRIHVWKSTGNSFSYQGSTGWWSTYGYTASRITGRVVSVNIDRDGKIFDDIAVFYDYGGGQTRMHVFESNGSSFSYSGSSGWWSTYGYTASKITGRVVAIDTRSGISGGKISDILALYDYGTSTPKFHIWKTFNPLSGSNYLTYSHHYFDCTNKVSGGTGDSDELLSASPLEQEQFNLLNGEAEIFAFPNPTSGKTQLSIPANLAEKIELVISSSDGKVVMRRRFNGFGREKILLDLDDFTAGLYFVTLSSKDYFKTVRLIKK